MARTRTAGHPVDPVRRCAAARRLSGDDRVWLCAAESGGRPALCGDRPARAHGACLRAGARMSTGFIAPMRTWWDSDLAYDFRRSPVAIVATIVTILLIGTAIGANFLAPYNVNDPASA